MTGDDFARLMPAVAAKLLGEANKSLSKPAKGILRFGTNGSMEVNTAKGLWHDFESERKGGVLDLIAYKTGRHNNGAKGGAIEWLVDQGLIPALEKKEDANTAAPDYKVVQQWNYIDEAGALAFQVQRLENGQIGKDGKSSKTFRQRHKDETGAWVPNVQGVRQIPYRLPELIEAISSERTVFVVEGEKCADALWAIGIPATTNAMGAGKWPDSLNPYFADADVVVLPDNDKPGVEHAAKVAESLNSVASRVRLLSLPSLSTKGDVVDWIRAGGTPDQLYGLVAALDVPAKPIGVVLSGAEFIEGFKPPDYLIVGILQRRFVYSMTAPTGAGKTAVALRIAAHVGLGLALGKHTVKKGGVLYMAGENPDDVRMRWIMLGNEMGFDPRHTDVEFVSGSLALDDQLHVRLYNEILARTPKALIVVDTAAAYGSATVDDENSNAQMGALARSLRRLTGLPGGPCVLIPCHPTKNAASDNLQPRGGGAFINEMDGNLVNLKNDSVVDLSWQGKFRGPDFEPISFRLATTTCDLIKDSEGRLVPSVVATPISESEKANMENVAMRDEDAVLLAMLKHDAGSLATLAAEVGWALRTGDSDKKKVQRICRRLAQDKLTTQERGWWLLTDKGKKAAISISDGSPSKHYSD